MKEGTCSFCEDPLPEDAKGVFCDEMCKDLQSRSLNTKRAHKPKDTIFTPLPVSPSDVKGHKKKGETETEQE